MTAIISIEGLGKKYRLQNTGDGTRYKTLREELMGLPRRLFGPKGDRSSQEEFWALRDVSFDVQPGERVGIIGRNGAGKSTLLKLLARITEPSTGRITLRGRVASLLEVGTGFHPELSGRENIYLNGAILGMHRSEIRSKFDEIVDFSGVEKFLDTPVKRYSSGMYVRLAFAVAAHLDPEILIVDEVLAVGDAAFQKRCLNKMEDIGKKDGKTVLFVSHNMTAVRHLCSLGICLDNGQIKKVGEIGDVVDAYLTPMHDGLDAQFDITGKWDDVIEFSRVYIEQSKIVNPRSLDISIPATLIIEYSITQEVTGFRLHVDICGLADDIIVRSFHTDNDVKVKTLTPGHYVSKMFIPAFYLGPTTYKVIVYSSIFNVRSCAGNIISTLETVCSESWCGPYLGDKFRAQILARLNWTTEEKT